jgi:DNA repair exonuclease SbcCD nuclease subunit
VTEPTFSVCLGDLFDSFWSDAQTLKQGLKVYENCQLVLTGNHDRSNRANAVSALEFIEGVANLPEVAVTDAPKVMKYEGFLSLKQTVQWIDHKMTQTLFDASIDLVEKSGGLLFLHCNYDSGFATDESSLNLSKEQVELLLTKVDKIFIGHEHQPNSYFDGRVIICGNIHPTSFSDVSDKYSYTVDDDLNVTKELIWESKQGYIDLNYRTLLTEQVKLDNYQFIEITGKADTSELPSIARAIAGLWKAYPNALMIKNAVTSTKVDIEQVEVVKVTDMLATISGELKDTKLHMLWQHYLEKIL